MADPQIAGESRNHAKMAEMVQLIAQRGPKIDGISRLIGVHNETVRYWYRQLLSKGFVIQASCNYESLGMKRVVALVELGASFKGMSDMIFYLLNQLAYVTGYARTTQQKSYILSASVPQECLDDWADLMVQLKKMGVFDSIKSVTLDWVRNVPMRAESFDFDTGRWDFSPKRKKGGPSYSDESLGERQTYDTTDLKIIGQLQVNANMSLREMCEKVGAKNYKTFTWHFREHVFRRGMIKSYRVNWTGMKTSAERQSRRQRLCWLDVMGDDLSQEERLELATRLNASPFVWMEGSGTKSYYARMVFPIEHAPQVLGLLETAVSSIGERVRWYRMNPLRALYFSLETDKYDEKNHRWNLSKPKVLRTFESLHKIKHETSRGKPP